MSYWLRPYAQTQRKLIKVKTSFCTKEHQTGAILFEISLLLQAIYSTFWKKAQCLHDVVTPTANKPQKEARAKETEIAKDKSKPRLFEWITKHQEVFDALKEPLSNAQVLVS